MALVREDVRQEDWEFFNALNIQFERKHIMANKYSKWVIDREREIIFTRVQTPGRDYGETYILIWGKARVYIYLESWSTQPGDDGRRKYHWDIQRVTAPIFLRNKRDELISLIREVADINYDRREAIDCINPTIFVIDNIVEPQFVEGE